MPISLASIAEALRDRYVLERELGSGGMATVYLARDLRHDRLVAVKVLRPEVAAALGSERFLREIRIAAGLTHPHILPLYDSGESQGVLYYVMPFVAGETLRDRLVGRGALPVAEALKIAHDVASGVGYAHAKGIVHRDIKPENILLEGGEAVVADFGIARAVTVAAGDQISEPGFAIGTPQYMSPEQGAAGKSDERSDVYSLGCVLYEMLAGEPPFNGPTAQALAAKHIQQPVPSVRVTRPSVPTEVDAIIQTALAKAPPDRYADGAELAQALEIGRGLRGVGLARTALRRGVVPVLLTVLAVAGGRWAWVHWVPSAVGPASAGRLDPTHIAVLYFEVPSDDQTLRYVSGGLTEDLIDQLGQVEALHVISSSGVSAYRERTVPLDSIVRDLAVGTIVTGRIARVADRLRISVRLIDAASGHQLRSETLERPWGDLFALEDEIAQEVSRFLRGVLGQQVQLRERMAGTRSLPAWELVQRVERQWEDVRTLNASGDRSGADGLLATADSLLARAESYDRGWVEPVLLRGWLAAERAGVLGTGSEPPRVVWIRAGLEHAARALALRPDDPPALELRGTLRFKQWLVAPGGAGRAAAIEEAERDLRAAAVPTNPSQGRAWSTLSLLLQVRGKLAEANLAAQRAYAADAFLRDAGDIVFRLYFTSFDLDREADARRWCAEGRRRFPNQWRFAYCQLAILLWPGGGTADAERAWRLVAELERLTTPTDRATYRPRWHMLAAGVLARAGRADSARAVIARSRAAAPHDPEMDYNEAVARMLLGEHERALNLLRDYLKATPQMKEYVTADPSFRALRDDARFKAMTRPL